MTLRRIHRALISVSDKTGIVDLARTLTEHNVEIVSSGGTYAVLSEAGIAVTEISQLTGFPEMLDGRVKTLHPKVHGGILAIRDDPEHQQDLSEQEIDPIDLVICNLYPFEKTVANPKADHQKIIENIDIGGPTLVRAAAKNYHDVAVITDPAQYPEILAELAKHQGTQLDSRERWAAAAFARIADYDLAIHQYFRSRQSSEQKFSASLPLNYQLRSELRYGENPHQKAAFYVEAQPPAVSLATAEQIHGKELSFNNYLDLDSALKIVQEFEEPAAAVLKHNNPCGAALGKTQVEAYEAALASDPESAFGSIICFNEPVEVDTAKAMEPLFIEVLMAPDYHDEAKSIIMQKKNRRILTIESPNNRLAPLERILVKKPIEGGWIVQTEEAPIIDWTKAKVVTKIEPTQAQIDSMKFAVRVCEQVKSNAIVMVQGTATVGIGPGQTSRVEAVKIAARRAGERAKGCVLASDAFFPFKDGLEQAANAGASSIVQPGGSIRDQEVIDAADDLGVSMLFTGHRLFRH